ncbi:MAG: hypothetical protein ABR973_16885 [Candidatus Acidiferrales bacterium]
MKQRIMLVVVIALNGTAVALAQTQDGRQACMNDAFQFCQDAIPDRERVFQCLVSHKDLISAACHEVMAPSLPVDQPPLKKHALHAKSAKGKAPFAKSASKAVSRHDRQAHHAKSTEGKVTFVKRGSKAVSRQDWQAHHAKSTEGKGTFVKRASKAVSRHDRHPLNLVPH